MFCNLQSTNQKQQYLPNGEGLAIYKTQNNQFCLHFRFCVSEEKSTLCLNLLSEPSDMKEQRFTFAVEVCAGRFFSVPLPRGYIPIIYRRLYIHSLFTRCLLRIIFFPTRPFSLNLDFISRISHLNFCY